MECSELRLRLGQIITPEENKNQQEDETKTPAITKSSTMNNT